jgi:hypothetical protein
MRVGLVADELWNLQDVACSGAGSGRTGGKPNSAAIAAASGSSQRIQSLRWYSRRAGVPMISSVRRLKAFDGLAMKGPRPDMNSRNAAITETPSARSRTAVSRLSRRSAPSSNMTASLPSGTWLKSVGTEMSTASAISLTLTLLDEFGRDWVLVTDDEAWGTAATRVTRAVGVPIRLVHVPPNADPDTHREFLARYGIGCGGASLIRPDGYIAWRAVIAPASRTAALGKVIGTAAMPAPAPAGRLDTLDDRDAIMNLTAHFADAINRGWNGKTVQPEAIPQLFAADGTFKNPGTPRTRGAAAIAEALPLETASLPFAMHAFLNPILAIDGDVATGNWLMWVAADGGNDPRTAYLGADFTYTRTPGGWRIQSVTIEPGASGAQAADTAGPLGQPANV